MIRPIDPTSSAEIELVAARMERTLSEVLGARGESMYTRAWLVDRVRFHLDPERSTGAVFLAEVPEGSQTERIVGHTIVRVEAGEAGPDFGLFSTTFVAPEHRGHGVARALLARGEAWMRERRLELAVTYTDEGNTKLQGLFRSAGYSMRSATDDFVRLAKALGRAE